ncbi:hypothetical protein Tco_0008929 [Tanacetum coccineum]
MTNKIDTFLKAINDRMMEALPSDTLKNPKLNVNPTSSVSSARSYSMEDPQSSSRPINSVNDIKTCFKPTNDFQKDQVQVKTLTVNKIRTPKPKEPERALEDEFKDLHLMLPVLEVLAHAPMYDTILDKYVESLELVDGTKSYPVGIVRNVEVHIGKLKLLENFYVIDMEKDHICPLLVRRGFLVIASAVIDYKKAKIAVGECITRIIFEVKEIDLGIKDVPYWTTIGKRESYEPRPSTDGIGAIPINLKGNTWESEELIEKKIVWNKPPKEGDDAWHIKTELIDPDGEKFNRTFQSILTTRKLSEKENPSEIIDLEHFHDS